jgi:TRAP-type C4-dicarboxylate transport system substrate-binding protein
MKSTLRRVLAVTTLLYGATGLAATASSEVVLKALTFAPADKLEESMAVFKALMERVNAAGKGEIKITIMGGPEVFPVQDQMSAVSKGIADIVMTFTSHSKLVPEVETVGLSSLTPEQERKVGYFDLLDEAHRKINIKVIGRTATNAGIHIFSKDPIRSLGDFKGLKIRSHSGYDPFFKALGAAPVGISIAEIYSALERGLVRAAPYPLYVYDLGLHEVTKFAMADPFWPSHTTWTYMNRQKWDGLGPKLQKLIMDTQIQLEKDMPSIIEPLKEKEMARLKAAGMQFVALPPGELKEFRQISVESRFEVQADRLAPDVLAKIKGMIAR